MQAQFHKGGNVEMIPYTPGTDIDSGTVIVIGYTPCVAHYDMPANILGDVALRGGRYTMTGDAVIPAGRRVWWDDTANKITETSTSNKRFGITASACGGDGQTCDVDHDPDGV